MRTVTRRDFLNYSGLGTLLLGSNLLLSAGCREDLEARPVEEISFRELPTEIKTQYDPEFISALPSLSLKELMSQLAEKGIYEHGVFRVSQVRANAPSDPMALFNNFYYTESELVLYATVARIHPK